MTTVGFVGLGAMGGRIAGRLLASGHPVVGWNRTKVKAAPLLELGLVWRDTPREVAETAEVVFSMVTDDAALAAIASGTDGLLAGLAAGKIWVDMSTVSPEASSALAEPRPHARRGDARRTRLGQRPRGRDRNADDHGRRRGRGLRRGGAAAARARSDGQAHRNERPGPAAEARGQRQPRRADARLQRGRAARRARRHRARAGGRGDGRKLDRVAVPARPRPARPRPPRRGLVRRRARPQRHPARTRDGRARAGPASLGRARRRVAHDGRGTRLRPPRRCVAVRGPGRDERGRTDA